MSKEEACDGAQVSGLANGGASARMGYVMLQQPPDSESQWLNTTKVYFSFLF